ncbi:MAG TPA: hypothetical protein VD963_11035 [Phycisphaerales bacterium]|nr:hypothetical protein [Phycisphaerales bacterium]
MRRGRGAGFTILEMIIAVAAVGLMAVGISQIFRATGDTVRAGRRVSRFGEYAALLERRLRADIAAMTRDGFLLVRNQKAADGANVPLYPGEPAFGHRPRRIDELVFFAHGDFETRREPIHRGRVARASEARVYYGHGVRYNPADTAFYTDNPIALDHAGAPTPSYLGQAGDRTNGHASGWVLLRDQTLLALSADVDQGPLVPAPTGGADPQNGEEFDSDLQVALQPAAAHVLRDIARLWPDDAAAPMPTDAELVRDGPPERPVFESGVIDIATTSLAEVRAMVLGGRPVSWDPYAAGAGVDGPLEPGDFTDPLTGVPVAADFQWDDPAAWGPEPIAGNAVDLMHGWMRQALPAESDGPTWPPNAAFAADSRRRRTELAPPNYLGLGWPAAQRGYERTDQMMLTASNIAPGCTNFIVEWSFGNTNPIDLNDPNFDDRYAPGELIWHGLERFDDQNGNAAHDTGEPLFAEPYVSDPAVTPNPARARLTYRRKVGPGVARTINQWLIHDADTLRQTGAYQNLAYSYFGYLDPTFRPAHAGDAENPDIPGLSPRLLVDVNGDGLYQPGQGDVANDPDTIPWAWPKLLRVTIGLADEADPQYEQPYQFVFEVPQDRQN